MNADNKTSNRAVEWIAVREGRLVFLFAAALLVLNLSTYLLQPTSWMDEGMFSDPAIHFVRGDGFISTAWWQSRHVTWSGNVPLFTLALIPWFKLVGISLFKARAFNYGVISLAIGIFWLGIKRLNLIPSAPMRVGLIVTTFLGFCFCYTYRNARPDCLGMLLCAIAVLAWSWKNQTAGNCVIFAMGFLAPMSGLQLAAYFGFLSLLIFILTRGRAFWRLSILMAGVVAGAAMLFSYYHIHHLTGIQETVKQTRQYHQLAETHGQHLEISAGQRVLIIVRRIISDQFSDFAILPTLLALFLLATDRCVWSIRENWRLLWFGVAASFALTAALEIFLHYLAYYHWMNHIIIAIVLFILLSRIWDVLPRCKKIAVIVLLAGMVAGGLPLRLGLGFAIEQPKQYAQLQQLVAEQVRPTDTVFADFAAYFPANAHSTNVYVLTYLPAITDDEKQSVNVMILNPWLAQGFLDQFNQDSRKWNQVGEYMYQPGTLGKLVERLFPHYIEQPTSCGYSVKIFRRETLSRPNG